MITYEYPFNERIRTLLRLEDLFAKTAHFSEQDGPLEHHTALLTLFDILETSARADLKLDLLQELERQRQTLLAFRNNPAISEDALSGALYEIEQATAALLALGGRIGQHLRDNEWLMNIKNRAALPGGVCEFDAPSYHFWLHHPADARRADLAGWTRPLLPLRDALLIVLRLLRASGRPDRFTAKSGAFQRMLGGSAAQMVRLRIPATAPVVPEISANKYALNIRFSCPGSGLRPRQTEQDVDFEMTFCNL